MGWLACTHGPIPWTRRDQGDHNPDFFAVTVDSERMKPRNPDFPSSRASDPHNEAIRVPNPSSMAPENMNLYSNIGSDDKISKKVSDWIWTTAQMFTLSWWVRQDLMTKSKDKVSAKTEGKNFSKHLILREIGVSEVDIRPTCPLVWSRCDDLIHFLTKTITTCTN